MASDPALAVQSFLKDLEGFAAGLDLGSGDPEIIQEAGPYKKIGQKGYERHHIPSQAALKPFGIQTATWPCISLTRADHAETDSFRGKQGKRYVSHFAPGETSDTYKETSIEKIAEAGGLIQLIEAEILNIRSVCGTKYDGAIAQYIECLQAYVKENGLPTGEKVLPAMQTGKPESK